MNVGLVKKDRIFRGKAAGAGNLVVYVGSKTGRDGIHGATMASAEFGEGGTSAKRPNVQVGDPFTEKLLMEACLEIFKTDAVARHSGHGRGGAHLVVVRDGRPRRRRHGDRARESSRCASRE